MAARAFLAPDAGGNARRDQRHQRGHPLQRNGCFASSAPYAAADDDRWRIAVRRRQPRPVPRDAPRESGEVLWEIILGSAGDGLSGRPSRWMGTSTSPSRPASGSPASFNARTDPWEAEHALRLRALPSSWNSANGGLVEALIDPALLRPRSIPRSRRSRRLPAAR